MDTFRIKKLPANDHNYLSFTQLLGYLKRKSKQLKACQQDPAKEELGILILFILILRLLYSGHKID